MNDDALKKLWQEQSFRPPPVLPDREQIAAVKKRMKGFDRTISWRDFGEVAACLFSFLYFGWDLIFRNNSLLTQAGCVVLIASAVFISWKLIASKRRLPKPEPSAPIFVAVKVELQKVENQIGLLESVAWWYLLPMFVGVMLHHWGSSAPADSKLAYSAVVFVLFGFIYWLNQRAVQGKLLPLKRELELLIEPQAIPSVAEPQNQKTMTRIILIGIVLSLLGALLLARALATKTPSITYADPVSQMLETIREKHNFPALAAAVVVDGKVVVTNAVGFRKFDGPEKVTVDDQFHLGSVTKSMTATVAAMLVEQGKISWATTVGETFPELKSEIHADYLGVTLEQLLSHRSGAPGNAPIDLWRQAWAATGTAAEQRLAFIKGLLARQPEAKPGTKFAYSNQGYTIAGVMLEKAAGKPWEELLRVRLFEPLGMTTAGFGAPASIGKVDQPWGHNKSLVSGAEPVPPGPRADNPLAISPAGAVHCSLGDLAKYAAFHMAGERGESKLLKAESFKKLHTVAGGNDNYALGWIVLNRPWANGRALMHNGSNTMFYVVVWLAPDKNCAVIVASNVGVNEAFAGCDEAASKLIRQYFGK
ncbi:MAG: class A beta-lactamase-related serine hydrolase [Proteobacteria bacterium]|nr:class A beta-lactamase-related serine hydrolase [Pseudomonadota bacterium]